MRRRQSLAPAGRRAAVYHRTVDIEAGNATSVSAVSSTLPLHDSRPFGGRSKIAELVVTHTAGERIAAEWPICGITSAAGPAPP
jgi:hypothetical protein